MDRRSAHAWPEASRREDDKKRGCKCRCGCNPGPEMEPVWKFFCFRDPNKEAAFQEKYYQTVHNPSIVAILIVGILNIGIITGLLWVGVGIKASWCYVVEAVVSICVVVLIKVRSLQKKKFVAGLVYVWVICTTAMFMAAFKHVNDFWMERINERIMGGGLEPNYCHPDIISRYDNAIAREVVNHMVTLSQLAFSIILSIVAMMGYSKGTLLTFSAVTIMSAVFFAVEPHVLDLGLELWLRTVAAVIAWPMTCCMAFNLGQRKQFDAEHSYELTMKAAQEADSILNHTLKNSMADAAGLLDAYLQDAPELPPSLRGRLELSLASLWRGMRSCRHRQVYMNLVKGTYVMAPQEVNIREFLSDLTKGRMLALDIQDFKAILDPVLLALILDNALSNASKHGHPSNPDIQINAENDPGRGLVFRITNMAHPNKPLLTDDFVLKMFDGTGPKHTDSMSDGIGLQHTRLAAQASSSTVTLRQEGDRVIFEACVAPVPDDAVLANMEGSRSGTPTSQQADLSTFPRGLVVCCIDDSAISLFTMKIGFTKHAHVSRVGEYGSNGAVDVAPFLQDCLDAAHIAILDYHLDFRDAATSGLELVASLRSGGFDGLICMRSGNTADRDILMFKAAGCHCIIGKDLPMSEAITLVKVAYLQHYTPFNQPVTSGSSSRAPGQPTLITDV